MVNRTYTPVDLKRLRTYSIRDRAHKAETGRSATLPPVGASFGDWFASLPGFLGASALCETVEAMVAARSADRPVVAAMGAHVVKVGCSPIIVDLIERGVITGLVLHGATAIHDVEMALFGATSEEVADTIRDGSFGMVEETLSFFGAVSDRIAGAVQDFGLGRAIADELIERDAPNARCSLLAASRQANIPVTVHVAIGTDTVHVSPALDPACIGAATHRDFRLLCDVVSDLGAAKGGNVGGVWLNIGSAVLLPEVFLKAVSVARNLGADLDAMVTANMDMLRHYRPTANVVTRPVARGMGRQIIGHHEIMLPLMRQAIIERVAVIEKLPNNMPH